jgi:hypothetical protein
VPHTRCPRRLGLPTPVAPHGVAASARRAPWAQRRPRSRVPGAWRGNASLSQGGSCPTPAGGAVWASPHPWRRTSHAPGTRLAPRAPAPTGRRTEGPPRWSGLGASSARRACTWVGCCPAGRGRAVAASRSTATGGARGGGPGVPGRAGRVPALTTHRQRLRVCAGVSPDRPSERSGRQRRHRGRAAAGGLPGCGGARGRRLVCRSSHMSTRHGRRLVPCTGRGSVVGAHGAGSGRGCPASRSPRRGGP